MLRLLFCSIAALGLTSVASADDPKSAPKKEVMPPADWAPKPEQVPAPRSPAVPLTVVPFASSPFWSGPYVVQDPPPQPGTREVWQYYALDRSGRFLPRVILAPSGSYYQYNGQPYPWTTTRPTLHMPYALD